MYKPLATALKIVTPKLTGDVRQVELVRAWERESGLAGFVEATAGTDGGRLRDDLRQALRKFLRSGRCEVAPTGRAVQTLAHALDPDTAGPLEKHLLREAFDIKPTLRTELAQLVMPSLDEGGLFESDVVALVLESASPRLREILDAIVAYETFARTVDACFKKLCYLSNAIAPTPLVLDNAAADATIMEAAARIPLLYNLVVDTLGAVVSTMEFGTRFADFSDHHTPTALAHLILDHHAMIQRSKPPLGKRPWFEPYKNGCLVRFGYGVSDRPSVKMRFQSLRVRERLPAFGIPGLLPPPRFARRLCEGHGAHAFQTN
ncbi:hypothetical protein [Rhodococcoides fascians]|uniref:hypothetical protein n=1 Tax=Rhodococcoides fascians TaxID=1828 RepID=UPI0012D2F254|nr:hypothetical protein [Rhodococcus fascians]